MTECPMGRNYQLCSYRRGSRSNLVGNILGGVPEEGQAPLRRGFTSLTFLTSFPPCRSQLVSPWSALQGTLGTWWE